MKKILVFVIAFAVLLTSVIFAAPGDTTDPIVVLSYLNQRINNLVSTYKLDSINGTLDSMKAETDKMQTKIDSLEDELSSSGGEVSSKAFEIVEIRDGEKIICESGTELILRGGKAFIIGSDQGGLADVTKGADFLDGREVISNHFMLVPRSDGRGVYTEDYAIFMVRGKYEVKK